MTEIKIADQDHVDLYNDGITKLLKILGHPEALVTDLSDLGCYWTAEMYANDPRLKYTPGEREAWIAEEQAQKAKIEALIERPVNYRSRLWEIGRLIEAIDCRDKGFAGMCINCFGAGIPDCCKENKACMASPRCPVSDCKCHIKPDPNPKENPCRTLLTELELEHKPLFDLEGRRRRLKEAARESLLSRGELTIKLDRETYTKLLDLHQDKSIGVRINGWIKEKLKEIDDVNARTPD